MNPLIGETANPITQARLVGDNIAYETYSQQTEKRGDPGFVMSRGELMEFDRCPHRWLLGYESEKTNATEWGELIDCLILTPNEFEKRFAVTPETYPSKDGEKAWNWNANYCKEWRASQNGKKAVKHETATLAGNATKFLLGDREVQILLNAANTQVMVTGEYSDEDTGIVVSLRALLDIVPQISGSYGKCLADLKTCTSAALFPWTRAVFEYGYHVQAAFYLDLYTAATGEDRTDWLHVCQESYAPWELGKRLLSAEFVELGRMKYIAALQRYCKCLEAQSWPGYDEGDRTINGWSLVQPEAWMMQ